MRVPRSFTEGLVMFFLLIPIIIYYLIVGLIKGIIYLIVAMKS